MAAGMNRGLNVEPMRWSELLAIAQRELNEYQLKGQLDRASELYDEELASSLIAAARIILEVANRRTQDHDLEGLADQDLDFSKEIEERHLLLILAATAFGMYGNFPSAAAVQRQVNPELVRSEGQLLALAMSNPSRIGQALRSSHLGVEAREFLERLNMFLLTGDEVENEQLVKHFEELMTGHRPLADVTFLRGGRLCLKHCINLSIARVLKYNGSYLFNKYVKRIISQGRMCLLPPQYNVIQNGFLDSEENAVVTIPTSTGKTLLAELAIASRMTGRGDIALYITPYIALGRQVYECFQEHVIEGIDVRGYFGTFNSHIDQIDFTNSTVIIATPERADAILRSNDLYSRLRTVVFDEAHGIENGIRGARLEALIARMRLQQIQGLDLRIILLSAVLADVEDLRKWLGSDAEHYDDSWRPTARRLAIWTTDGKLGWLYGADPLRPISKQGSSYLGRKTLEWPAAMWPASQFGAIRSQLPSAYENVSFLARYVRGSIGGPVLIACYSKQTTRGVAAAVASTLKELDGISADREKLIECLHMFPHLGALRNMVSRGVAYHNSSLPGEVKTLIEKALKSRSLQFVAATTTLAEGVDLPIRCTIIFDWLIGFGENQTPMAPLLFRNIAGRCGRAGEFTEGDTIIFDNVLGQPAFVNEQSRRSAQARLFSDPPALRSEIANDNLPDDLQDSIKAVLSSQLMAAIPENPDDDAIEVSLSLALYASQHGASSLKIFEDIRAELLSDELGEPFARAASPMWLTHLGQAANRTGFGPGTCRKIISDMPAVKDGLTNSQVAAALLKNFGVCQEQNNYILKEVVTGRKSSKLFVKMHDLEMLGEGWLNGSLLTDIFVTLPKAQQSKAAIPPLLWAAGEADSEFVAAQYDKFVELMEYAFGAFLPWLLRAIATLSSVVREIPQYPWNEMADLFENCRTEVRELDSGIGGD
ncbi:helicase [Novosphingobium hassiacum]|uniref:Helicase n=1 Tax=Novosphingobium hassiacum TaxID=173676 RepID=A0A7W5ZTU9_9SPHN|nr:helicase [Novosphingobium hassiacum]